MHLLRSNKNQALKKCQHFFLRLILPAEKWIVFAHFIFSLVFNLWPGNRLNAITFMRVPMPVHGLRESTLVTRTEYGYDRT